MRVTQLDYSAIKAANAANIQANSAQLQNKQLDFNSQRIDTNRWLQDQAREVDDYIDTINGVKSFINTAADVGLKLFNAKYEADVATANKGLEEQTTDASTWLMNEISSNAGSFFDEKGNLIKPEAYTQRIQSLHDYVDSLDVMDSVKEQAHSVIDSYDSKAWAGAAQDLIGINTKARNEAWVSQLGDIMKIDLSLGSPDNGLEMIQNTSWLTPGEKESYSAQYVSGYNTQSHANEASRLARTEGQASANEYINGLVDSGDITEDEWLTLSALVNKVGGEEDNNIAQNAVQYATEQMQKGVFPVVIQEMIKPRLEAMDDERREYVQTELNKAYYKNALEQFNWPSDFSTLTSEDLRTLKADVADRGTALLPDMPTELNAIKSSIQKELDSRITAQARSNVQSMDLVFDMVGAGTISPAAGLAMIRELPIYSDLDTSDDEKAAEYMKKLADLEDFVPQSQQYLYKQRTSLLEDSIKGTLNLDLEDVEDNATFIKVADEARSYVLDYIFNTPAEDITAQNLNEAFDRAEEIFLGGTIQDLEAIRSDNEGRSLIQQGASNLATGYLEDVTNLLMMMPEGMISQNASGHYDSPSGLVTNYWMELDVAERNLVQQLNLGNPEHWQTVPYRRTNADGTTTEVPIPVLQDTANGTKYTIIGNNFLKQEKDSDEWDVVTAINKSAPLPADDTITSPTSAQIREGQSGIDVSNPPDISEYDDPWVLPTPDEVQQGQRSVVVEDNDGNAFAHLADEGGDIRVRRYKGQGTQFYYQGNWYRVNELPEDSPILKAYDEYMKTFKGTIPKVGY